MASVGVVFVGVGVGCGCIDRSVVVFGLSQVDNLGTFHIRPKIVKGRVIGV